MKTWSFLICIILLATTVQAQAPANRFTAAINQNAARIKVLDKPAEKRVDIEIDGKPFTSYHYESALKRPALFPILSPKGNPITRGFPMTPRPNERVENPNQIGMWVAYGNINGIDFWNDAGNPSSTPNAKYGTIVHKAIRRAAGGKLVGHLEVENEWRAPNGEPILKEVTLFEFEGEPTDRSITRTTTLTAIKEAIFMDTEDGFLGLRLARELEHKYKTPALLTGPDGKPQTAPSNGGTPTGEYINSESIKLDSVYGKRAEWVLLNGQILTEPVTVAMFDYPKNLGHPAYWNTNGTGLFAINPMGQLVFSKGVEELDMKIPAGQSLSFKHLLRIQSGRQLSEADCERVFTQFTKGDEE